MDIVYANLASCTPTTGAMVVIDVLRSFSTAAYAFAAGARAILPVGSVAEARIMRERFPDAVLMGAVGGGWPITDFDISNSPTQVVRHNLQDRRIIHYTAAGVQGLIRCRQADVLLAASLVCARATAHALRSLAPSQVTLVTTGEWVDRDGDEDLACADYLAALLRGEEPDPALFAARVRTSDFGRQFTEPDHPALPATDLDYCTAVNQFDFPMQASLEDGLLVMTPMR